MPQCHRLIVWTARGEAGRWQPWVEDAALLGSGGGTRVTMERWSRMRDCHRVIVWTAREEVVATMGGRCGTAQVSRWDECHHGTMQSYADISAASGYSATMELYAKI